MEQKELEKKQQEVVFLSMEICRLRKIISIKQNQYNKLDTEIYKAMQEKEKTNEKGISEDNK